MSCGWMPRPTESAPCGSKSTRSTRRPCSARAAPRFIVVVVLPTPPFWLQIAMTRAGPCSVSGSGSGKAEKGLPVGPSSPAWGSDKRIAATSANLPCYGPGRCPRNLVLDSRALTGRRQAGSPYTPDIRLTDSTGLARLVWRGEAGGGGLGLLPPGRGAVLRDGLGAGVRGGGAIGQVHAGELAGGLGRVREAGAHQLGGGDLATGMLTGRVALRLVRVVAGRQEPEAPPQARVAGELEVGPLGQDLDLVDGQGDADVAPPG